MIVTSLPQFQDYTLYIYLFAEVKNSSKIRASVGELPFALIDASTICSQEQLFSSIYKTLIENAYNRIRTKSLNSECILSLSPTSNIGEAFKRFGINEFTKDIICLSVIPKGETFDTELAQSVIEGQEIDFTDDNLSEKFNMDTIRKNYKLHGDFKPRDTQELSQVLVNAIQLRGL